MCIRDSFRQTEFDILYNEGISREGEIITLGVEHGIVDKAGAWYSYNGDRIGQGKDNVREYLKENTEIAQDIEQKIRAALGIGDEASEGADIVDLDPAAGET